MVRLQAVSFRFRIVRCVYPPTLSPEAPHFLVMTGARTLSEGKGRDVAQKVTRCVSLTSSRKPERTY